MIFGTLPEAIAARYFPDLAAAERHAWQFDASRGVEGVWDCNGIHVDERVMRDLAGDITTLATAEEYLPRAVYGTWRSLDSASNYTISTTGKWGWFRITIAPFGLTDARLFEAAAIMADAIDRWLEAA